MTSAFLAPALWVLGVKACITLQYHVITAYLIDMNKQVDIISTDIKGLQFTELETLIEIYEFPDPHNILTGISQNFKEEQQTT